MHPETCALCVLADQANHKPMHVSLTLWKAIAQLDAYCTCGATKGHGILHPHACSKTGCAGFTLRTPVAQEVR